MLYDNQGRYEEAEPLYQRALAMRTRLLGDEHPDVARSLNNLALLYKNQGRYGEAEPLYQDALAMRQRLLGEAHPDTGTSLKNLANLYILMGRYREAEPLYLTSLQIRQRLFGNGDLDVADSLYRLAGFYHSQENFEKSESFYRRALGIYTKLSEEEDPYIAKILSDLGALYRSNRRNEKAVENYRKALEIAQHSLGNDNPFTVSLKENLSTLDEESRRENHSKWKQSIRNSLLRENRVSLKPFQEEDRDIIRDNLDRDFNFLNLTFNSETLTLSASNLDKLDLLKSSWKIAKTTIAENNSEIFQQTIHSITDNICEVLLFKIIGDLVSYGQFFAFKLKAASPAFDLNILEEFPIIYIHKSEFKKEDIQEILGLLSKINVYGIYFAILVVFENHEKLRALVRNSVYKNDFIIVNYDDLWDIVAAKSPIGQLKEQILKQVDLISISPYTVGGPAKKNMFFGRAEEEKTLVESITSKDFALLANRKAGKTSLLHRVVSQIREIASYRVFNCDLQAVDSYESFFQELASNYPEFKSFENLNDPQPIDFKKVVNKLKGEAYNSPIIFTFDEVDELLSFDIQFKEKLFKTFRSLSQQGNARFIFSGTTTLVNRFHNQDSPFFNFCNPIKLGLLEEKPAKDLILEPMQALGIKFEDEEEISQTILLITARQPNAIQYICSKLIKIINTKQQRLITGSDLKKTIDSYEFYEYFSSLIWGQSEALEKLVVYIMWPYSEFTEKQLIQEFKNKQLPTVGLSKALETLQIYSTLSKDSEKYFFTFQEFAKIMEKRINEKVGNMDSLIEKYRKELA